MSSLRPWTDDIDPATIPDEVVMAEAGRRNNAKRKVHSGGAEGRPRAKRRCPCGEMTRARAKARGHKCVAPVRVQPGVTRAEEPKALPHGRGWSHPPLTPLPPCPACGQPLGSNRVGCFECQRAR